MPNVINTPLMGLPNAVPSADPGPDYATNIYNSIVIIDGHNHSVGSGNQISSDGINLTADLPFNSFNATMIQSVRFDPQAVPLSGPSDLGCSYVSGVDLWFNDGDGNQVQLTSGGSVNATSSGISNGTATASFSGGVLIVDSNTNTPANIKCGSVIIGETIASPHFITLASHTSLGADYSLIFPAALPAAQSFTTIDSSGNIATGVAYSGGLTTTNLSASAAIVGTQLSASANILKSQLTALGQQTSSSSGAFFSSSTASYVDVTNLSVTLTITGRPVMIVVQPDGSGTGIFGVENSSLTSAEGRYRFLRDAVVVTTGSILATGAIPSNNTNCFAVCLDTGGASGSHTYKIQVLVISSSSSFHAENLKLTAFEL